ncbi:uncharacterized protein LOC129613209 [Condylostylus longicornis]|uniref:uncharacterized protein LOC129613209 n=1 Tax=Condylostylus longicornis TaxID=2530218 RepID=UPI00244D9C21|nr:uncharacterized protein LOC129613209 [Condylostylus longicornis]
MPKSILTNGNPAFWKNTPLDPMIEEMRSDCVNGIDSMACFKVKIMKFIDTIFKKDNFKVGEDVEVRSNDLINEQYQGRGQKSFLDRIEQYIRSHDYTFKLPVGDVTISPRNLDDNEMNVNLKFGNEISEERGKKSKLRKIAIPIMVFVLLKAMTLIPLALGILGLKAWNSLQLGFLSFIVSVGLAIFELCKKIAADHHHAHIAAHGPWDGRSFQQNEPVPVYEAQNLAYNAYA